MMEFLRGFRRNADGSWTCVAPARYSGPDGRLDVTPGTTFTKGTVLMGVHLAQWLDDRATTLGAAQLD